MPTFYRLALDTLVSDIARSLRPVPIASGLNRPAITLVEARAGYDRDMLIRDAVEGAAARHGLLLNGLMITAGTTPEGVRQAVATMLVPAPAPRVLVLNGLMGLPPALRQPTLDALRGLDDAPAPCHVLITTDATPDVSMDWGGRTQRVNVDLSPRTALTAVVMARGATLPGRPPLVRRLFLRQWDAVALLDRTLEPLFAEALGEFTADHLAREAWPWLATPDDPVMRLAHAARSLTPSSVDGLLRTLVQRLANHPLMAAHTVANVWDEPQLDETVRAALMVALSRPATGWGPARLHRAERILMQQAPSAPLAGETVEWTVVDGPIEFRDEPEPLAQDVAPALPVGWRGWWPRWSRWWTQRFAPVPSARVDVTLNLNRGEALVWGVLQALSAPERTGVLPASERWVLLSAGVVRTTLRWPADEMRATLATLFDGLGSLPGLWAHDPSALPGTAWSMTARHALMLACEALPGWTPAHQQTVRDAFDPAPLPLYTSPLPLIREPQAAPVEASTDVPALVDGTSGPRSSR